MFVNFTQSWKNVYEHFVLSQLLVLFWTGIKPEDSDPTSWGPHHSYDNIVEVHQMPYVAYCTRVCPKSISTIEVILNRFRRSRHKSWGSYRPNVTLKVLFIHRFFAQIALFSDTNLNVGVLTCLQTPFSSVVEDCFALRQNTAQHPLIRENHHYISLFYTTHIKYMNLMHEDTRS
jgi:hypothetical protein